MVELLGFYSLEPMGEARADLRAALVAWVIASVNAGKGNRPQISDFLLDFEPPPDPTPEVQAVQDELALRKWLTPRPKGE